MLTVTSVVFVARTAVRVTKRKTLELQDFWISFAYVCYVAMVVMHFKELEPLYRIDRVLRSESPRYAFYCE
jgi:hypothetical protein